VKSVPELRQACPNWRKMFRGESDPVLKLEGLEQLPLQRLLCRVGASSCRTTCEARRAPIYRGHLHRRPADATASRAYAGRIRRGSDHTRNQHLHPSIPALATGKASVIGRRSARLLDHRSVCRTGRRLVFSQKALILLARVSTSFAREKSLDIENVCASRAFCCNVMLLNCVKFSASVG